MMPSIPDDLKEFLDPGQSQESYAGPIVWLWVFDPQTAKVTITHNEDRPPAEAVTHKELAPEATHPGRVQGYAYHIKGGFRITDDKHKAVTDPYITEHVRKALKAEAGALTFSQDV